MKKKKKREIIFEATSFKNEKGKNEKGKNEKTEETEKTLSLQGKQH
jgi:hypothetical protein